MSDGTTTTRHEPILATHFSFQDGSRREVEICRRCREAWPCEVSRLRERVAALEAAGNAMVDELVYLSEWGGPGSDYVVYSCHACGVDATSLDAIQHDADCNVKAWLAALAQAGDAREDSK